MAAVLNRFISRSSDRLRPFFLALKAKFEWDEECDRALENLKEYMSSPALLVTPIPGEELFLYLMVSQHIISAILVRAEGIQHLPIYYVSKTLLGTETRYLPLEKLALALMMASRKLSHYFHAHTIVVLTAFPLKALFERANFSGRILKWAVELGQFDIKFQPRTAIKAQSLVDFVEEFIPKSHHICPVNLTNTIELGMEVDAGIAQPLVQDTQSDPKADQSKESKAEVNHVTPSQDSPTNKDLVQSDSEGQTASMDLEENTSNILDPTASFDPSTCWKLFVGEM
ncbi:unnamed protein product [Camellia sinensis]